MSQACSFFFSISAGAGGCHQRLEGPNWIVTRAADRRQGRFTHEASGWILLQQASRAARPAPPTTRSRVMAQDHRQSERLRAINAASGEHPHARCRAQGRPDAHRRRAFWGQQRVYRGRCCCAVVSVRYLQSLLHRGAAAGKRLPFRTQHGPLPVPGKAHPSRGRAACPGFRYARFIRQHMPQARSAQARLLAACVFPARTRAARATRHAPDRRSTHGPAQRRRSSDCARREAAARACVGAVAAGRARWVPGRRAAWAWAWA
ncbi:hypothetical protein B0J12DRAFT_660941 [Macrophomina phaseolina]|uniref:Uncharacterized protein n=1 Tax=Macrophomina phaseolina TaxID=35725 RepID=A0ABQ8GDN3_9PEZI|nr:hypothetical protein B0J12DRAFT_660941 [Macrophomina phaseolina]